MFRHCLTSLLMCAVAAVCVAMPDPPGPATVHVVRSETILTPQKFSAPRVLYPEGRVDFDVVEKLVDAAMVSLTGLEHPANWQSLFAPNDRVAIMVDASAYPAQTATVETIINRLVGSGLSPQNIIVFAGDERDLFSAGYTINREAKGVRVLGSESEGYRGRMSRIVSDYCDAVINVAALKADDEIGFAGCVANALSCVPTVQRVEARQDLELLPRAASLPAVRQKTRLCFLEAYLPLLAMDGQTRLTWQYKGLLASTDPVAVDLVGRSILQQCRDAHKGEPWPLPQAADYLQIAQTKYRLGQAEADKVTTRVQGPQGESLAP